MATTGTKLMTAEELLAMPEIHCRYELIRGRVIERQFGGAREGIASSRIFLNLAVYAEQRDLGMVLTGRAGYQIEFAPDHVRAPSIAFIKRERLGLVERDYQGYFPAAPDIVIENATTSDTYQYMDNKVQDWLTAGAGMVIVVNADNKSVMVHHSLKQADRLTQGDTLDGGNVLPGWSMPVADIFGK